MVTDDGETSFSGGIGRGVGCGSDAGSGRPVAVTASSQLPSGGGSLEMPPGFVLGAAGTTAPTPPGFVLGAGGTAGATAGGFGERAPTGGGRGEI